MLRLKYLTATCVAAVSLALLTFTAAPAMAFTMTFDEYGNCSSTVGTCSSTVALDPSGKVTTGDVLIYNLPTLTYTGTLGIKDANGTLSDAIRWVDSSSPTTTCGPTGPGCANEMIFYSLDNGSAPADVGSLSFSNLTNFITENADGTFSYTTSNGVNTYDGISETPLPAALPLFATGLGALGLLGWRRKRKALAA
jgi:hypothetical protein